MDDIHTGGGDYAEGDIDKRQGAFIEGGTVGTVIGVQQNYYQVPPHADRHARLNALLSDHRSFMQDRLDSFVGRVEELAAIRQRIAEQQPMGGYVTITGQAGQGKSSIIAKLVEGYGPDTVAHHFIPFTPGPDHQVSLLRNLMARLILKYDLLDLYVTSESRAALRDFFPRVLRELAAKGGQEVIFIDGLDQIERELTGERDLSFLPTDPPAGVVFVLGTRPDDTLTPLELLKPRHEYRLPDLSRTDFDLILAHRGVTLAPALADRFYHAMQQNALYLDLLAKELHAAPDANPAAIIEHLSDNPDNLFSLSMQRLKRNKEQWRTVYKPILGVLLAAQQPMSQWSLRAIIGLEDDELRDGLRYLGGLLASDGNGHYYLFHLKLQDFLRQDEQRPDKDYIFATDEEQSHHTKLADWCESGKGGLTAIWQDAKPDAAEQERRGYAREHFITHLYQSREWERMFTVLDDGSYGQSKVRWDPSTRSYAQDLDLGRRSAAWERWEFDEGIAYLPHLWRYSLLRCTLASHADNYRVKMFSAMILLGQINEAIALADLLSTPEHKSNVLLQMGLQLTKWDEHHSMGWHILRSAWDVAYAIAHPWKRIQALSETAVALILNGEKKESEPFLETVAKEAWSVKEDWIRAYCLGTVAVAFSQTGNPLGAEQLLEKATSVATRITDDSQRKSAFCGIAESLALTGRMDDSERLLKRMEAQTEATNRVDFTSQIHAKALRAIALNRSQSREWTSSIAAAEKIERDIWKIRVKKDIITIMVQNQELQRATSVFDDMVSQVQTIQHTPDGSEALGYVVAAMVQIGFADEALSVARDIPDIWQKASALAEIALSKVQQKDFIAARKLLDESKDIAKAPLPPNISYVHALSHLATKLASTGDLSQSKLLLEQALRFADTMSADLGKGFALRDILVAMVRGGFYEDAIAIITERYVELEVALTDVAEALAKEGYEKQAIEVAHLTEDRDSQVFTLCTVAAVLARRGQRKDALKVIEDLGNHYRTDIALREISLILADTGQSSEALTIALTIKVLYLKMSALCHIGVSVWQYGDTQAMPFIDEAIRLARSIEDHVHRTQALCEVVVALAKVERKTEIPPLLKEATITSHSLPQNLIGSGVQAGVSVSLAAALAWGDYIDEAREVAERIETCFERSEAFQVIAEALVKNGNINQAKTLIQRIDSETQQPEAMQFLSLLLARQGEWNEAIALAQEIGKDGWDKNTRASTLANIVILLLNAQENDRVIRLIQQAWLRATTRDEIIHLLEMATPLIPYHPDLGPAFVEGFAWVDDFLRG